MYKIFYSIFIYLLFLLFPVSCQKNSEDISSIDYRNEMRQFVINIAQYARNVDPDFIVIPQNGQDVAWSSKDETAIDENYLAIISGTGREDLFFGYKNDNVKTPKKNCEYLIKICNVYKKRNLPVLVTDYCSGANSQESYKQNSQYGYIAFAAPERNLNQIPRQLPNNVNANTCTMLSEAKNFLYLINQDNYSSDDAFLEDIAKTNYDVIIIDACNHDGNFFTSQQISKIKIKPNGSTRLVIAYMSIGEAEDYRQYWSSEWKQNPPLWLDRENPKWQGNYKVKYWDKNWQAIIYGNSDSYLSKILKAEFDGVYLDIIDAFEYYEK